MNPRPPEGKTRFLSLLTSAVSPLRLRPSATLGAVHHADRASLAAVEGAPALGAGLSTAHQRFQRFNEVVGVARVTDRRNKFIGNFVSTHAGSLA